MAVPSFPTFGGLMIACPRTVIGKFVEHEAISGMTSMVPLRSQMRYRWELQVSTLRSLQWGPGGFNELETLDGFFSARMADGLAFGYTDPDDHAATSQGFGQGDGVTTQFQLVRARGGFAQPVYLAAPTAILVAGVAATYTLSAKGVVTFASAPASGAALTWTGAFQWLCRFDKPELGFNRVLTSLYEAKSITFTSLINP